MVSPRTRSEPDTYVAVEKSIVAISRAKPWIKELHASVLGIRPRMRIVDVGCGTGDFTRHLADLAKGKCKIIGVDNRTASLKSAERETEKEGLGGRISYRKGDAYEIPVRDNWSDLTCCRTVLMHLTDPLKAVQEMTRITATWRHRGSSRARQAELCLHS